MLELFSPAFQPLTQVEPLAGGANTFKAARGNVTVNLQIVATIPYSSLADALAGIATVRAAFTTKKHLKVEQDATVHYYPNAHLTGYQPVLKGVTIQHSLSFTTDDLTTEAPA